MTDYRAPTDLDRAALRAMGHRLPLGCDYQGRHPEAAEAATEVGSDDNDPPVDRRLRALIWRLYLAVLLVGIGWGVSALLPLVTQ